MNHTTDVWNIEKYDKFKKQIEKKEKWINFFHVSNQKSNYFVLRYMKGYRLSLRSEIDWYIHR